MPFRVKRLGPLSFYREALSIALPVMLQQFIMSMVSLIDNFMVAGLGDASMAAVNVANQMLFIYIVFVNITCQAGGIYLAQFRGANDPEGMKHAYRFKVLFGLAGALAFFVLFWIIPEGLIGMMTVGNAARDEVIPRGANYLRLISFTLVPMVISTAIGSSLRETGETKVPLYISAIATVINTIGNWFLIYGNLGAPRLEISGAAIATIAARTFEAAAFIIYANRKKIAFYSPFRYILKVDRSLVRKIISKSVMMFISEASWVASETIMVALYNGRGGAETMAGMSAGSTIANIFFLLFGGIWTTAAVLVGGSLGAGKLDEARSRGKWILSGGLIAGAVISIVGAAAAYFLIPLVFSNLTLEARGIGLGLVLVILCYFPIWAVLNAQFAVCRAGGDTFMGFCTDTTVNVGIVIPGAFLLAHFTDVGPVGMFGIIKSTDILKCFIARYFYNKERWVRNLTV
ncbi:MATE family efflux transporter [Leadbettera azotonutricia]|uniref:Multidrug-efflux transporter n=1 Tax=Leadbettera azotonutricia (strain ATCC BAA-888 / DSM 13862 / ZAS-9) TaxID=545695 RepID=F5YEF5_LEAAZ|nr:MATE family efflux transporter [Leadbettera azotonutricia]AEF80425.1 MATE efflux family protein [Leadbettera azotonutricia ZAS-9]